MSIVLDTGLFGQVHFEIQTGLSSGSQGYLDMATSPYVNVIHLVPLNTWSQLKPGYNTYYKLQGYNAATGVYEFWHCMNTPILTPPSGDTLLNVSIVATWTDR
jgi:hypothetical protein